MIKKYIIFLLLMSMLLSTCSCGKGEDVSEESANMTLDYSDVVIRSFVRAVTYKGLTVTLADESATKEAALWAAILDNAQTENIPDDKAMYYFNQTKEYYLYFAGDIEKDYEYVLKHFGTDESKMMEDARALVKKDLIYLYIVESEGICVTDEERTTLFEKYVDKYVSDYGYRREYVLANMTEMIYDSMLYDKTMEFLISNNTFTAQ